MFVLPDPIRNLPQWAGIEVIQPLAADAAFGDQPRLAKELELLRDRRLCQVEGTGELRCGPFALVEESEQRSADRARDGSENICAGLGRAHDAYI